VGTPASSATSYCSVPQFLYYYDWRSVADLVSDLGARATQSSLTSDPNLAAILLAASGRVESATFRGQRYIIDPVSGQNDLASLIGASASTLQKLVADLAFGFLFERRPNPGVEPPISYQLAIATLDQLRDGELVFGLVETMAAGHSSHLTENAWNAAGRNLSSFVARRYFGRRGAYRNQWNQ
jgi:hypothetical protein